VDDDRIMVAGFVPDGPAARSGQIKIGKFFLFSGLLELSL